MAAIATLPATLYDLEDHLLAMTETAEVLDPEQEQEFREDFGIALRSAVEKRDRVGQFIGHLESQIDFAEREIERLRQRKASYQRTLDRIRDYVAWVIESLGPDERGKFRKLEGETVTFSIVRCPPSVEVTDEDKIPSDYKLITVRMPLRVWEILSESLDPVTKDFVERMADPPSVAVNKGAIKAAFRIEFPVEGAQYAPPAYSLRRT